MRAIIRRVTDAPPARRPVGFAIFLLITGLIGFLAAFQLIVERIHGLQFPAEPLSCAASHAPRTSATSSRYSSALKAVA